MGVPVWSRPAARDRIEEIMKTSRQVVIGLAIATLLCQPAALAQGTSSLRGSATDPTGAVIPGATIEILNVATEAMRKTESNAVGLYQFPQVKPGTYRITATAAGFVQVSVPDVRLPISQPVTIDIQFQQIAGVTGTVTVEAVTESINTVDASLGNAVGTNAILQLPFEGRNVIDLLSLQPGVAYIRDTAEDFGDDTRSGAVNGGKSDQANITLDGVDVNDQQDGFAFESVLRTTLDSVQEFRTTTLNAGADQGRSSGAQVALVTKSGGNGFHGSLYEYHRNTVTSANSYFNNAVPGTGIDREKLIRNVFGASLGGPIQRNRLFFFFNYEGQRDASEQSVVREVPTAELRQGIVRYLRPDGSVASLTPEEIQTRIDPTGIGVSQAMLAQLNNYPLPNVDTTGDGLNTRGFLFNSPVRRNHDTYITRWDWHADRAGRHRLFFRGQYQDDRDLEVEQFPGTGPILTGLNNSKGVAVGYDSLLSPTLTSAFRYGYTRQGFEGTGGLNSESVGLSVIDDLYPTTRSSTSVVPVHTFREDLSWIKRNHGFKFGGVIHVTDNDSTNFNRSWHIGGINPSWLEGAGAVLEEPLEDLDETFTSSYRSAMANVLGLVSQVDSLWNYKKDGSVQPSGTPLVRTFSQEEFELYFMDTWQVARGLTLSGGIRWSLNPPVYEKNGFQTSATRSLGEWFNTRGALAREGRSQAEAGEIQYVLRDDPNGRPLYAFHKRNFAPRVSLAYSPQVSGGFLGRLFGGPGRTAIRAGFGMFYDNFGQGLMRFSDFYAFGLSTDLVSQRGIPVEFTPRFTAWNQVPAELIQPAPPGDFPQTAPPFGDSFGGFDDTVKPPYSMALGLSIGRELPHDFFFEASYVGRLSRRSLVQRDLAQPTDITDPDSGMTYFGAAKEIVRLIDAGALIEDVAPIPYWENMFPDLAFSGLTATQNAYDLFSIFWPDYTYAQSLLDEDGYSRLGPWAYMNEQYLSLTAWSSVGGGNYHSGQFTLRKRFRDGIQFDLNYTLAKSIDIGSVAERGSPWAGFVLNAWAPGQMKAVSDYDVRHLVNANWVVELPFGRNKRWGAGWRGIAEGLLGGWQVSGLWRMSSGLPASVRNGTSGFPTNWQIAGFATQDGPSPEQGVFKNAPAISGDSGVNIFPDPEAAIESWWFTDPGESGQRNGIRGDGYFTLDMGLSKRFPLPWEGHSVQLRWEVFNVTNSVRFDPWSADLNISQGGSFGKYAHLLTNPRVMQFALRYDF